MFLLVAELCSSADLEKPLFITERSIEDLRKEWLSNRTVKPVRETTKKKRKRRKGKTGKEVKSDKAIKAIQTTSGKQGCSSNPSGVSENIRRMDGEKAYREIKDYGTTILKDIVASKGQMDAEDLSNTCSKPPIEATGKLVGDVHKMYGQINDVKKDGLQSEAQQICTNPKDQVAGKDRSVVEQEVKHQCSQKGARNNENSRGNVHKDNHFKDRKDQVNQEGLGKGGNEQSGEVNKEDIPEEKANFDTLFVDCMQKSTPNEDTRTMELVRSCVQQTRDRGVYDTDKMAAAIRRLVKDGRLKDPGVKSRKEGAKTKESIRNNRKGRGRKKYVTAEQMMKEEDLKKTGSDRKDTKPVGKDEDVNIDKVAPPKRGDSQQTAKAREETSVNKVEEDRGVDWLHHCLEEGTKNTNKPLEEILEACVQQKQLTGALEQGSEQHVKQEKSNVAGRKKRQERKRNHRIRSVKNM